MFNPNTGKYGPEKTPNPDTFDTILTRVFLKLYRKILTLEKSKISKIKMEDV